jgi:hypothetical protein
MLQLLLKHVALQPLALPHGMVRHWTGNFDNGDDSPRW